MNEVKGESEPGTLEELRERKQETEREFYETYARRLRQLPGVKVKKHWLHPMHIALKINRVLTEQNARSTAAEMHFHTPAHEQGLHFFESHGYYSKEPVMTITAETGIEPTITIRLCQKHGSCEDKAAQFIEKLIAKSRKPTKWEIAKKTLRQIGKWLKYRG